MPGRAPAAMTFDVCSGLPDDDRSDPAARVDAAAREAASARVGTALVRTAVSAQECWSARWAPWGSNPQPAD